MEDCNLYVPNLFVSAACMHAKINYSNTESGLVYSDMFFLVSTAVVLTPSSISACSGDAIIVRCSESDTSTVHSNRRIRWIITPRSRQIPVVELTVSEHTY